MVYEKLFFGIFKMTLLIMFLKMQSVKLCWFWLVVNFLQSGCYGAVFGIYAEHWANNKGISFYCWAVLEQESSLFTSPHHWEVWVCRRHWEREADDPRDVQNQKGKLAGAPLIRDWLSIRLLMVESCPSVWFVLFSFALQLVIITILFWLLSYCFLKLWVFSLLTPLNLFFTPLPPSPPTL